MIAGLTGVVLSLAACGAQPADQPPTVTVYAAASLEEAFDDLIDQFHHDHPGEAQINAVYDGSATLITQISHGAPADVLATANESTMQEAHTQGLTATAPEIFATNELVIGVPQANPHQVGSVDDAVKLPYAACAPQVPCGQATADLLAQAGIDLNPVSEETSVTAVANRVSQGEVEVGFVYATDVAARPDLRAITPQETPVINHYPIAATSQAALGQEFIDFVLSPAGQDILARYGFGAP